MPIIDRVLDREHHHWGPLSEIVVAAVAGNVRSFRATVSGNENAITVKFRTKIPYVMEICSSRIMKGGGVVRISVNEL